jgi:hypothetical protein
LSFRKALVFFFSSVSLCDGLKTKVRSLNQPFRAV